jgi:hypothetical protein
MPLGLSGRLTEGTTNGGRFNLGIGELLCGSASAVPVPLTAKKAPTSPAAMPLMNPLRLLGDSALFFTGATSSVAQKGRWH